MTTTTTFVPSISGMGSQSWCRCFACLLLICYRQRPFLASRGPALVTAFTSQAAQCPCNHNLCTSFVIIHCIRLAQNHGLKTIPSLFSCSLGHSDLLLWEKTDSEIGNCFSLKAWHRCQYKHQRLYHYSPDLGYTAHDFLLHVIYTLLIHCWRWWGGWITLLQLVILETLPGNAAKYRQGRVKGLPLIRHLCRFLASHRYRLYCSWFKALENLWWSHACPSQSRKLPGASRTLPRLRGLPGPGSILAFCQVGLCPWALPLKV